jgi:pyruvate, water dikinase
MEIKGAVASAGNARGQVRVIGDISDAPSFKVGEILVVRASMAELIPVIRNAVAVIADEGGMMSHAAIISREMKKPCIVGTKNASQILKTGDFVEIDGTKGTVTVK